jgi:hypothetical protein
MPADTPRVIVPVLMAIALALSATSARSIEASTADDTARFLAGLQPSSNSPIAVLTKDSAWLSHARYFDGMFAREESAHLSKVREFSKEYLTKKHDTMLYMFSGPDFLYANSFFPNASIYVLAGLEPVGEIPDLTGLSSWAVDEELRNLESSMGSLFSFSFFITSKMKTQLHEGPVYGTLPVLYVFLARTGKTIHDVTFGRLDEQGVFQIADNRDATNVGTKKPVETSPRNGAPVVEIVFSEGNGPKQALYYFSTNLADGSFEQSGFAAFLTKLGPADSFIKSASYLLHRAHFASVRKFLLDNSATILQDDSGIPVTFFDPRKWQLQAFGRYAGPISMFANFYQPRMADLFQGASPIEFGIGYRWRKNESNLILAEKGSSPTSDEQLAPNAVATAAPSPKSRKRVETEATRSLGCRIARVFPFCW